jgi:arsenate reductase (thioredoxin)
MKAVIFACVENAGRSQMAAELFNQLANPALARAVSAGTRPANRVHPEVAVVMSEMGIDISATKPKLLTPELVEEAYLLVTMGCGDQCPIVPGLRREDWALEDPKGRPISQVRQIRDAIGDRVRTLIEREGWARRAARRE